MHSAHVSSNFTTDQISADMDAVRNALGLDEVTFYGNSYGTLFAVAYATRFPDRTAAIYLDGVVLIDESGYNREPMGISTADIDYVCARSPACDALPGRPALTLQRLITQLRATPDPEVPIAALPMLLQGVNPVGMRELPAAASAYLAGDPAPLRRLTAVFKGTEDPGFEDAELAGTLAIYCGDTRFPFERNASREERYRQLARFRSESRPLAPFEIEELPNYSNWADYCLDWPTLRASPPVPPNAIYPRVPVLAAAGDLDTWSLAEVADLIGRFPESTLLPVVYGGHSLAPHPGPHGLCVRETMRRFLADPRHPTPTPEGGMNAMRRTFRALGSFPVTLTGIPSAASEELSDPEARVVSAAFATAADAVARRNPNDAFGPIKTRDR